MNLFIKIVKVILQCLSTVRHSRVGGNLKAHKGNIKPTNALRCRNKFVSHLLRGRDDGELEQKSFDLHIRWSKLFIDNGTLLVFQRSHIDHKAIFNVTL